MRVDVRLGHGDQLGVRPVGVLADDVDPAAVLEARVDHDALARVDADARRRRRRGSAASARTAAPSAPRRRGGSATPRAADEHLARAGSGIRDVLVAQDLRAAVLVDPYGFHAGTILRVTAARARAARGGARPRRRRGGAGRALRRDRARTSASAAPAACSPTCVHDGAARGLVPSRDAAPGRAHGRLGGALLLRAWPGAGPAGTGGCRATPGTTRYAELREQARRARPAARRRVPRARRREPARRPRGARPAAGVGFYGKNTLADHAAPRLLGRPRHARHRRELEATPPLDARLRLVPALHRRVPDRTRSTSPGTLDATRCLSYWTQSPRADPGGVPRAARGSRSTAATSARTSARGTAASRSAAAGEPPRRASRRLARRLARGRRRGAARAATSASTSRATTPRFLRRNALVALGNAGGEREHVRGRSYADAEDELLASTPRGRSTRIEERSVNDERLLRQIERWIAWVRFGGGPRSRSLEVGVFSTDYPAAATSGSPGSRRRSSRSARSLLLVAQPSPAASVAARSARSRSCSTRP